MKENMKALHSDLVKTTGGVYTSGGPAFLGGVLSGDIGQEARSTIFCHSQKKFHTVVLKGVRNISDTL